MKALLSVATAIDVLAIGLLLLLTPLWTNFALDVSGGGSAILATPWHAHQLSDRTVSELLLGPGTFSYSEGPGPVIYPADEAAHLRDARLVLWTFLGLAAACAVFITVKVWRGRADRAIWRAVARGGAGLALVLGVLGIVATVAWTFAFELFHRLLFPGGNYSFDPRTSILVQLYPAAFWQLCAAAMGVLGIGGGLLVWGLASRRAARLEGRMSAIAAA